MNIIETYNQEEMVLDSMDNLHKIHSESFDSLLTHSFLDIFSSGFYSVPAHRDLARTRPACLLDSYFSKNLLFGLAKFYLKNFQFLEGNNQIFS